MRSGGRHTGASPSSLGGSLSSRPAARSSQLADDCRGNGCTRVGHQRVARFGLQPFHQGVEVDGHAYRPRPPDLARPRLIK